MKLAEIEIENFKGIGEAVKIKIDNIVALIGNNNVGKTTILSAYEAFADSGTKLTEKDFYKEDTNNIPTITGIFVDVPTGIGIGEQWIHDDEHLNYKNCIKVKYIWEGTNQNRKKYSYLPADDEYVLNGTGGFDTILSSKIPTPIKISPLEDPLSLQTKVLTIINETIKANVNENQGDLENLMQQIDLLTQTIKQNISNEIDTTTSLIAEQLTRVFPEYNKVEIDIQPSKIEADKLIASGSMIRLGNVGDDGILNHSSPLSHHGTGLQRTFLWSALKMLAETGNLKKGRNTIATTAPKILLIEEPEAFLHPNAIREAREALYSIADLDGWQVMTTTHSPMFIDLTKDHTTIIRIEKDTDNRRTIKTFSTEEANFTDDEKMNLKMLNYCNPYFNEFFFAKTNLLVEGETEFSVIKLVQKEISLDSDVHILNCLGKGNIVTVAKILNHFKVPYSILHDSDNPTLLKRVRGEYVKAKNGAWTNNLNILQEVNNGKELGIDIKLFVSVPNFEGEFLKTEGKTSKPYEAWKFFSEQIGSDENADVTRFIEFLKYSCRMITVESSGLEYSTLEELEIKVNRFIVENDLSEDVNWDLDHYNGIVLAEV
ncbi:ATP-dependent nuclease [Bacillus toyonensis]|uniref:ATP-dependent nuclease n=1 Tax=Bacillus toyonensis TaxID=155322 RepID=UPI002E1D6075|nr:AAA family ATPase [Bacillus toyonensis]HDR7661074.1 AAA family ATPase [Bacillus wiedmannii]